MTSELQSVAPNCVRVNLTIDDLSVLINELESIAPVCYNFGLQLGVRDSDIRIIQSDNRECKVKLREVIVQRLKQESPLTWYDIVRSLRKECVKEYHLANILESKYITPNLGSDSVTIPQQTGSTLGFPAQSSSQNYISVHNTSSISVPANSEPHHNMSVTGEYLHPQIQAQSASLTTCATQSLPGSSVVVSTYHAPPPITPVTEHSITRPNAQSHYQRPPPMFDQSSQMQASSFNLFPNNTVATFSVPQSSTSLSQPQYYTQPTAFQHSVMLPVNPSPMWSMPPSYPTNIPCNLGPPQPKRICYDSPMTTFINYVKAVYKMSVVEKDPKVTKWPPTPTKVFINLACIDRGAVVSKKEYDEITQSMVRDGNIDIILKKKRPITFNDIVNDLPSTSLEKVILVEGAPGVGKSTFAWEFCRRWERGEIAQQYQLVLLLRLRDERMRTAKSLSDLIYHPQKEICKAVETEMFETLGINILIILEGFDELQKTESSVFVELIGGQLLPFATIMITSRPWATSDIHKNYNHRISKHIEILGFTDQQITEYMESVLSDITDLEEYLKNHPQIRMCMYIPLNSAIVVCVYQESKKGMCPLPKTSTELYIALTKALLLRYLHGHPQYKTNVKPIQCYEDIPSSVHTQFLDLCELAYRGIATSSDQVQLIFTDLPSHFDNLGFMDSVTDMYVTQGAIMSHNFLHLTVQEFLAAQHISVMSQEKQLEYFDKHKDGRFKVVLRFLSGINKLNNIGVEDFKKILDEPLCTGPYTIEADVSVNQQTRWIFEAGRGDLLASVFATDTVVEYLGTNSTIQDYFSLGYCIAHSQCCWVLSIADMIGEEEVKMFLAGINTKQEISARVVAMRGDEINDLEDMNDLLSVSAEGLNMLFSAKNIMSDLQELSLYPPVECCSIVWPNLSKLKMLKLGVHDLTTMELDSLLPDLSLRSLILQALNFEHRDNVTLSRSDCEAVAKLISLSHCLENMCVYCDVYDLSIITKAMANNVLLPLQNLEVQNCYFIILDYLSQFITNSTTLQSLIIKKCGVHLYYLQDLFEAILCRSIHIELNFSIPISGGGVYELVHLMEYTADRIDSLYWNWDDHTLKFSGICDEHIEVICDALQDGRDGTIYELNFGWNEGIGEAGTHTLVQALAVKTIHALWLPKKCQEYALQCPQYDSVKTRISYL